jgi:hypothetical protein
LGTAGIATTIVQMHETTTLVRPEAELTVVKSPTPAVYVPRRFRIGGLAGVPPGAAIVGTPQGGGMVAIDFDSTPYVDPNPEVWGRWVAEAARRHVSEEELPPGEEMQTTMVSEHDLVEVGMFDHGQVVITDEVARARLSVWVEAGRTAFAAGGPFPGDEIYAHT